jgi:hypothetical protein
LSLVNSNFQIVTYFLKVILSYNFVNQKIEVVYYGFKIYFMIINYFLVNNLINQHKLSQLYYFVKLILNYYS